MMLCLTKCGKILCQICQSIRCHFKRSFYTLIRTIIEVGDIACLQDTENYTKLLEEAKADMLEMFYDDDWRLETGKSLDEGLVYSKNIKKFGRKLFKLRVSTRYLVK